MADPCDTITLCNICPVTAPDLIAPFLRLSPLVSGGLWDYRNGTGVKDGYRPFGTARGRRDGSSDFDTSTSSQMDTIVDIFWFAPSLYAPYSANRQTNSSQLA
ncbi:unnamed protein product [Sympodiomycopsis kandeliae]